MIKIITLVAIVFTMTACSSKVYVDPGREVDLNPEWVYKVYKIDSTSLWNIIYVKHDNTRYKVISQKQIVSDGKKIRKNRKYNLRLHSVVYGGFVVSGVNCISLDTTGESICLEREKGVYNLLIAENLSGLYLVKVDSTVTQ